MTEKEKIEILISQFVLNNISENDKQILLKWRSLCDSNGDEFNRIVRVCKEQNYQIPKSEINQARERLKGEMMLKVLSQKRRSFVWVKIAAVFVLALLVGSNGYTLYQKQNFVANYSSRCISVATQAGERSSCTLADNSQVWLNSNSNISFNYNILEGVRLAKVSGELFFDIAKDKIPFIVESGCVKIRVYGTQFNVKNLNDQMLEVTLKEGSVALFTEFNKPIATLVPGERAVVSKDGVLHKTEKVIDKDISSWMKSKFVFRDKSLEEIASFLEEIYNVKVLIKNDKLKNIKFRCIIYRNKSIVHTLENLNQSSGIKYSISNGNVVLF